MESLEGHGEHLWNPLDLLGIDHPLLHINAQTLINTWIVLAILFVGLLIVRFLIAQNNGIAIHLTKQFVGAFKDLVVQTLGSFHYKHTLFVLAVFTFILLCNLISLIPGLEEPTADLNTTLAMGLISFVYKDFYAIVAHGFFGFLQEFLHPFFLMFPLNVIGHLSKVISISFRLFGNIFGGSIITKLYMSALGNSFLWQTIGLITGLNFVVIGFFVIFEGLIQAFVFAILTLNYLAIAVQSEGNE
jgi:F-type H+-transporting ATPase subunit a